MRAYRLKISNDNVRLSHTSMTVGPAATTIHPPSSVYRIEYSPNSLRSPRVHTNSTRKAMLLRMSARQRRAARLKEDIFEMPSPSSCDSTWIVIFSYAGKSILSPLHFRHQAGCADPSLTPTHPYITHQLSSNTLSIHSGRCARLT